MVSLTLTAPEIAVPALAFETVKVYVAPFCPCVKLPECAEMMLSVAGGGVINVESIAGGGDGAPPPETLTLLTWGDVALLATVTATITGG
jgi:hypothetical protein